LCKERIISAQVGEKYGSLNTMVFQYNFQICSYGTGRPYFPIFF